MVLLPLPGARDLFLGRHSINMPLLTELVSIEDRSPRSGAMTLAAPFKARATAINHASAASVTIEYFRVGAPGMLLPALYVFGMRQLAAHFQGRAISDHEYAGGRKGSWLISIAVGLVGLVCVVVVVFVSVIAFVIVSVTK